MGMNVVYKRIDELVPYARNPRRNDAAVEQVAASIRQFGFKVPIIIDADGQIVAGHTRIKAAHRLGMSEVPCIVADDLSPEQIKAFRLADNKVGELATWDATLLTYELDELEEMGGLDMSEFGFDSLGTDAEFDADEQAPEEFKEISANTPTKHVCPKCGYEFN